MAPSGMTADFAEHLKQVRTTARELHSPAAVEAAIDKLAAQISAQYEHKNPLLITVLNGGVVLSGRLLCKLNFPLEIDYLHATRYRGETQGSQLQWIAAPSTPLAGRHVIILDDILDVGSTLVAIVKACQDQNVASVATAVLVDKQHDYKAQPGLKADFTGLYTEDAYLFGCGMDYRSYWRNAPGIYAVDPALLEQN